MGKCRNLSNFDKDRIVTARQVWYAVASTYLKWSSKGQPVNRWQGHIRPTLSDVHVGWGLAIRQSEKHFITCLYCVHLCMWPIKIYWNFKIVSMLDACKVKRDSAECVVLVFLLRVVIVLWQNVVWTKSEDWCNKSFPSTSVFCFSVLVSESVSPHSYITQLVRGDLRPS